MYQNLGRLFLHNFMTRPLNYLVNYLYLPTVYPSIINYLFRFRRTTRIIQCLATNADVRWQRCIRHPDATAAASIHRLPDSPGTASESTIAALHTAIQPFAGILCTGWVPSCHESACTEQLHRQRGRGRQRRFASIAGSRSF